MSNGQVTFASGGLVKGGSLTIASSGVLSAGSIIVSNTNAARASMLKAGKAIKKLQCQLEEAKAIDYCHSRRGGPRSKVFCEVPKTVPHEIHSGRGNTGYWFSWKERECFG